MSVQLNFIIHHYQLFMINKRIDMKIKNLILFILYKKGFILLFNDLEK